MSRQVGYLHCSIFHLANLQNSVPIIPLFACTPHHPPHINISSGMDSDDNSDITVFQPMSQFDNSDLVTRDEFAESEPSPSTFSQPSPSTFSQPPFRPIHSQAQSESSSTPSHFSQVTATYSSFTDECSNNKSPDNTQISYELNNLITLQQQVQHFQTLSIHQISATITSSNPPTLTLSSDYTPSLAQSSTSTQSSSSTNRAYRDFKRKFPNHPFHSKPGTARKYKNHPDHTNTTKFLQVTLPFSPQYTYNHSGTTQLCR